MNIRKKISVGLLSLGVILAFLPLSANRSFTADPKKILPVVLDENNFFTVDQVAKFIVSEDSTVQIIDLRSPEEFISFNLPGSINVPYNKILELDPASFITDKNIKTIFYSNGDFDSNYALVIAKGMKYNNVYVMKGGLNEWFKTIIHTSFTGDTISARENALFETRTRAKKMFTEINSLPDSLKVKYIQARQLVAKKLDGGCE